VASKEGCCEKNCKIQGGSQERYGCDGRVVVKNLDNLEEKAAQIQIFVISYHYSYFLATTLIFSQQC